MIKFYVYTSANGEYEFIEANAIEHFALHEFNPSMAFTGVSVEAEDFESALQIYQNPGCGFGEYILADEPDATVVMRQARKSVDDTWKLIHARLEYQRCMLKMKLAATKMHEANKLINEISHELHRLCGAPKDSSPTQIFEKLSTYTVQSAVKFYGDPKKSG
jgi:hypothetical protein